MSVQIHSFENLFPKLISQIFSESYKYYGRLEDIHQLLTLPHYLTEEEKDYHRHLHEWKKDRDSIFVKKFHDFVDKNTIFNETYYQFLRTYILPLFPNETKLVVQKTPNIRFSLPNNAAIGFDPKDPDNIVGLHCDSDFGHHETETNIVVPITEMFGSNSIYYEPYINSNVPPSHFENLSLETNEFLQAYFNKIKHCNRINQTNITRISFDIRVIPFSKYQENIEYFNGTKFELGKYYILL
jgi:hypothetical protein